MSVLSTSRPEANSYTGPKAIREHRRVATETNTVVEAKPRITLANPVPSNSPAGDDGRGISLGLCLDPATGDYIQGEPITRIVFSDPQRNVQDIGQNPEAQP